LKAAVNRDEKPAFLMNYLIRATAYVDGWTLTGEGEP
jgi:hypothetical protein